MWWWRYGMGSMAASGVFGELLCIDSVMHTKLYFDILKNIDLGI